MDGSQKVRGPRTLTIDEVCTLLNMMQRFVLAEPDGDQEWFRAACDDIENTVRAALPPHLHNPNELLLRDELKGARRELREQDRRIEDQNATLCRTSESLKIKELAVSVHARAIESHVTFRKRVAKLIGVDYDMNYANDTDGLYYKLRARIESLSDPPCLTQHDVDVAHAAGWHAGHEGRAKGWAHAGGGLHRRTVDDEAWGAGVPVSKIMPGLSAVLADASQPVELPIVHTDRKLSTKTEVSEEAAASEEIDRTYAVTPDGILRYVEAQRDDMRDQRDDLNRKRHVAEERLRKIIRTSDQWRNEATALKAQSAIRIIFDGPPSHESGRFVEVENDDGQSIAVGEWKDMKRAGLWELRIPGYAEQGKLIADLRERLAIVQKERRSFSEERNDVEGVADELQRDLIEAVEYLSCARNGGSVQLSCIADLLAKYNCLDCKRFAPLVDGQCPDCRH